MQLYRHDGWEKFQEDCGSLGGGSWSPPRHATDDVVGTKTLWVWRAMLHLKRCPCNIISALEGRRFSTDSGVDSDTQGGGAP